MLALAAGSVASLCSNPLQAQNVPFAYTGPGGSASTPTSGFWNTAGNWSPGTIPPSASTTEVDFGGSGATAYNASNNIGGTSFSLNEIKLNSTASVTEIIASNTSANTLNFVSNGANGPQILQNNTGAFNINSGIILSSDLTVGGTGTGALLLSGNISGGSGIIFGGADTVTLSGPNAFTGNVTINSGTVVAGNGAATNGTAAPALGGNGNTITVNSGATLAVNPAGNREVFGGNQNNRTLVLNGGTFNASYNATGDDYVYVLNMTGGTVSNTTSGNYLRTSNASGGGVFNTYASSTPSTFGLGMDMTWASLTFNIAQGTVANGGPDFVWTGNITQDTGAGSGAKSLTKNGNGFMTLSTTANYTGPTTINAGTLMLNGSIGQNISSGTNVSVASGAAFAVTGSAPTIGTIYNSTSSLSVAGGATLSTADGAIQTLTINSTNSSTNVLTLGDSGSTPALLKMDVGDLITTPGAATIQNSGLTVSVQGLPTGGQQTLIYAANGLSINGATTVTSTSVNGYTFSIGSDANHLYLVESAAPPLAYWNGTVNSSWNYFNNGTTNFVNGSGTELGQTPGAASDVFFTNNTVGPGGLNTTLNGNFTINSLTFTGTGTSAASPVSIAGPGTLTIVAAGSASGGAGYGVGTGIVVLPGSGAHTISAPLLLGGTGSQSWTNNSTNPFTVSGNISGGTLGNGSTGTASVLTLSNGTFNFTGNNTYLSSTNLSGGVLNYMGAANSSGNSAFVLGTSANAVVNLNSSGTVAMGLTGGVNTSSVVGVGSSAAVNQSSGTVSMNVFSGSSAYLFMGGQSGGYGSYTLTGGSLITGFSAGIVVGYAGQASFLMTGGTMSLAGKFYVGDGINAFSAGQGVATFTGGTITQSSSPIQFGSTGGFGMGGALNLGTLAGGSAVYSSTGTGTSGGVFFNTGTPSLTNAVNLNHGTLSLASTITAIPGGAAAYIDFNGGTLQASGGSSFTLIDASLAGILVSNTGANIDVTSGTKATISGNLIPAAGNGVFGQSTNGAFSIGSGGGSGYIGGPLVQVSGGSGSGASAIANISNGVVTAVTLTNPGQNYAVGDVLTFSFSGGGASNPANNFNYTLTANDVESNGGGGLNKTDSGTLILSGSSSYTGPTNILGGTLQVGSGTTGSIPNTSVNIASGAFLGFGRTDTALVFPNTVTGAGGLVQSGTGSTTLTGTMSYTGPTNVIAGRLIVSSTATLGNSSVNVSAGVFNPQPLAGSFNIGAGSITVLVKGGASLSLVDGAIGVLGLNGNASGTTLTIGNTSGTSAGNLNFEISQTAADKLVVSGSVLAQSSGVGITITPLASDASLTPGNYTLITAAGGLDTSAFNISNAGSVVSVNGGLYDLSLTNSTATAEILTVKQDLTSISAAYWNGALSSTWNTLHGSTAPYTTNWRTTSTSGTDTGYYPSSITNVFFTDSTGGTNLNTSLGANTTINSLSFDGLAAGPVGIGGNYTLSINASTIGGNAAGNGINIASGSTTVTISSNVSIGSTQTWTNSGTNPLIVSGSIGGAYSLIQAGTGPLTLSGANTFSGGLNSSGGSLNLNNAAALGTGPFTVIGAVTLDNTSGGPITLNTNNAVNLNGNLTFNGSYSLNMGNGAINVSGASQVSVTANTLTVGGIAGPTSAFSYYNFNTGGAGTLNVNGTITGISLNATGPGVVNFTGLSNYSGATNITGGTVNYIGGSSNIGSNSSTGIWTVAGVNGATLNINSTGNFYIPTYSSSAFSFEVGGAANTSGNVLQTNGTVTFNPFNSGSYAFIGASAGSYGSYTLTGGTLTCIPGESVGIVVGYDGTGSFLMTGGTLNMSRVLYIGDGSNINSTGQGVATLTGGTISVVAIAGANAALQIGSSLGYGAGGAFNLGTLAGGNGTYTSNVAGSSIGGVHLETQHGLNASINLDHGTMSLAAGIIMTSTLNTNGYVNLDGGVLQATGSFPLLDASLSSAPGSAFSFNAATVYNGGAIFDVTAGNVATIPANLIGATGNGFYGQSNSGVFNVSSGNGGSGYVGAPLVTVSGGSGSGAQAIATVSNGVITSVTLTNPGQNYQVGDTLSFSFTSGGASLPSGGFNYTLTAGDLQANNGGFTKTGAGTLVLSGSNTYTGPTIVTGGTLQLVGSGALPPGTRLTIGTSSSVVVPATPTTPVTVLQLNGLSIAGTNHAWTGKLDLGNGAAVVHGGSLSTISDQVKQGYNGGNWQGSFGITSSAAAADTTDLTAIAVIANNDGSGNELYGASGALGSFESTSPQLNDVLIRYTYYGDTDLSGVVDGTDYSRIDSTYLNENFSNGVATNPISGWFNGDFNFDGVVDGSDYTLMDNVFNNQTAMLSTELATSTALVGGGSGTSAVPEPSTLLLSGIATLALLGRRRRATTSRS